MPPNKIVLDDDQRFALMKFRRKMADVVKPKHDDRYLLRWLRARNWDVDAAEKMLRASLKWRDEMEVDTTLKSYKVPDVVELYNATGVCGYDNDGAPIVVMLFGPLDVLGMVQSCPKKDLVRSAVYYLEQFLELADETDTRQVTVIFDMEGFNVRQYAHRPVIELVIELLQIYEANYPEILKICYIINAPSVFAIVFNIVKKFLHEYTLSKIQIHKSDPKKWKKAILSNISPDNLPQHYGGTLCDPDGNPRLTTKIKQGGKIPKSYYRKNLTQSESSDEGKQYKTTVIKKGDKFVIDFIVPDEGCFLRYDFYTEGHDIRFGVTMKDEDGNSTQVIEHKRVPAQYREESGVIQCQAPATYFVTFDNSYSLIRSKKLHYCVDLSLPDLLPEEALDIVKTTDLMVTPAENVEDINGDCSVSNGSSDIVPAAK